MLIRKVSEIGVVICSKNTKKTRREEGEYLMRKILNLIIFCKTLQKNGIKLLRHYDQSKQKLRKIEAEKSNAKDVRQQAMETFTETRKRKHKDDNSGSKRNYGLETMIYLKQQELELRKQELALEQERQ